MSSLFCKSNFIGILIVCNAIFSVQRWSTVHIGNQYISWIINIFIIAILFLWYRTKPFSYEEKSKRNLPIILFLIYAIVYGVGFGLNMCEGYYDYKNLVNGFFMSMLPLFALYCQDITNTSRILNVFIRLGLPVFVIFYSWSTQLGAWQFYFGILLLLGIYMPLMPKKYRCITIIAILIMCTQLGARAQVIKCIVAVGFYFAYKFRHIISKKLLTFFYLIFISLPLVLIPLAVSGQFNLFEYMATSGEYENTRTKNGEVVSENLASDTRTFIYAETILSAYYNDYIWQGRTLARGNDTAFFDNNEEETGRMERYRNEVCFPNVFTWLGIIGLVLFSSIFIVASWLAFFKSNSLFIKYLGLWIAFHWTFGWIEDIIGFTAMSISIFIGIGMCLSTQFRSMTDDVFSDWFKGLFASQNY